MSQEYRTATGNAPAAVSCVSGAGTWAATRTDVTAGTSEASPLVNITNNVVAPPAEEAAQQQKRQHQRRSERFAARHVLRQGVSELKRVRLCGTPVRPAGTVDLRVTPTEDGGHTAGYEGLGMCGSVWACPVCSAKIQAERRDEIQRTVDWAESEGLTATFGTMTLRHNRKQPLELVWSGLSHAFRRVSQDKAVRRLRKKYGFAGYVRVIEVTHGRNGWHPHIHDLGLYDFSGMDDYEIELALEEIRSAEFAVWSRAARAYGLGKPDKKRYQRERVSGDVSDYLSKGTYDSTKAAFEMAGNTLKEGYSKSRTPWQILRDIVETYDADDVDLWREYEQVSRGRKMLTWSRGLKAAAGVTEKGDEEIAEEEHGAAEDRVLTFPRYDRDLLPRPLVAATLLTVAQSGNEAAIRAFCEEWGIETRPPEWQFAVDDRQAYSRMLEARARMNTAVVFDDQEEMPDEARREAVLAYFAAKDAATAEARAAQWATGSGQSPASPGVVGGEADDV